MGTVQANDAPWTIHTAIFDGPLDLLLYLIKRDGIDINKLKVSDITDSYLEYIDQLRELNLAIASEYLVMASTLVYLKSLELLPRAPALIESGHEEDPTQALLRRIREFAAYQRASGDLVQRNLLNRDVFVREPLKISGEVRPLIAPTDAFGLLEQFSTLLQAYEAEEPTYALEPSSALDFEASCLWVLRVLGGPGKVTDFRELLTSQSTRAERVVCFIALLEMARVGWVLVRQEEHLGPIRLEAMVGEDVDFSAIMGRVEREAAS